MYAQNHTLESALDAGYAVEFKRVKSQTTCTVTMLTDSRKLQESYTVHNNEFTAMRGNPYDIMVAICVSNLLAPYKGNGA